MPDIFDSVAAESAPRQGGGDIFDSVATESKAPSAPAPVLLSQTLPTPEQVDADTTNVARITAQAMIRRPQGPTISAPAQTPWYAQSFDDSGAGGGASLGGNLLDAVLGGGSAIGQAIRQNHPALAHLLGMDDASQSQKPADPTSLPLFDASALKAEKLVPGEGTGAKVARGVISGVESFGGGMTTPRNAEIGTMTGGLGKGAPLIGRLISAGFAAKMLLEAYRQIPEFQKAVKAGDFEQASHLATSIALGGVTAYLAGRHAAKGEGSSRSSETAPSHSEAPTSPLGLILYPEEHTSETDVQKQSETKAQPESPGEGAGQPHAGAEPGAGGSTASEEPRELLEAAEGERTTAKEPGAQPISPAEREPGVPREIGPHGPIYHEFWHNAQAALKHFETHEEGDAVGALHHPEVGDIDLPAFIARKLLEKHAEVTGDLQGFIDSLRRVGDDGRSIQLRNDRGNRRAAVRLDYDGVSKRWLVTAFDTDARTPPGRTPDVPETGETAQAETVASAGAEPRAPDAEGTLDGSSHPAAGGPTSPPPGVNSSVEAPAAIEQESEPEAGQPAGFLDKLDKAGRESEEWLRKNGISGGGSLSANRIADPQVVYHLTRAIAGDVARGVITLRDGAQQIFDRIRNRFPDLSLEDITRQIAGHIAEAHGRESITMGSGLGALQPVYERAARSLKESAEEMKALKQKRDEALAALEASESTPQEKEHGKILRRFFTGERDMWGVRVNQAIERLRKIVPDTLEQEALSLMRDFKDRPGELEAFMRGTHPDLTRMSPDDYDQAMKNLEPLLPAIERALSPTPRMMVADRVLTDIADKTLAEGQRLGILGGNVTDALHSLATLMPRRLFADPDVVQALAKGRFRTRQELDGFIDRIQPQIDSKVKGAKLEEAHAAMRQLQNSITSEEYVAHLLRKKSDQSEWRPMKVGGKALGGKIGREFRFAQTREIPTLAHAVAWGLKPPSLNALTAFTIHGDEFATARATHMLIDQLRGAGIGKWGAKTGEGGIPEGWTEIAPHAQLFQQMRAFADPVSGEPTLARQTLWVPRYVEEALRPITDPDYTSRIAGFRKLRMWQAFTKSAELGLSVFHLQAENMMALANMGPKGWARAQMADRASAAFVEAERDMVLHGGTSPVQGKTVEAYKGINESSIPSRLEVLAHAPLIKQFNAGAAKLTEFIFDNQMRRFKVINYSLRKAAWMGKHPNAGPAEMSAAMHSITEELNAVYGGLNWEDLGWNKATVEVARIIMLAPDWTISNFFNVRTLAEGGWKGTEGARMARMFWLRAIVGGLAATQGMSLLMSGHLSKRPTMVYLGKDEQGREIYQNIMFRGASADVTNLINDAEDYGAVLGFARFAAGKLGPLGRTAEEMMTNRDFLGREVVRPGLNTAVETLRGAGEAVKSLAPIPFSFTNLLEMLHGTDEQQFRAREIITTLLFGQPPRHLAPEGTHMTKRGLRPIRQRAEHSFWQELMTGRP